MKEIRRLELFFKLGLYVILVIPFSMMVIGGGVGPITGIAFTVLLAVSWFADARGFARKSHTRWWNVFILTFIAYTSFDILALGSTILDAGIRLVLVLILVKLFSRLAIRDELQIYALSFLALAAATTVNEGVTFGILFGAYVLAGTFSLAVFHLRNEVKGRPRMLLRTTVPLNRQYIAVLVGISILILASSIGIFFTFPRIGLGFFIQQSRSGVSVTGFNDSVELGQHGVLRDNPEVILRAEFPDGRPSSMTDFHWRTMTFDHYDGRRWSRSLELDEEHALQSGNIYDVSKHFPESDGKETHTVQLYLEPLGSNLLPVLWPPQQIQLGTRNILARFGPNNGSVTVDEYGDLRHTVESEVGVPYIVTVAERPDYDNLDKIRGRDPREADEAFRQMPEMSQKFHDLAARLTAGATTNVERARAVRAHLESGFSYTTNLPEVGDNPIESFLFDAKRGHCEYFATSAVLLLRSSGVPARLVNGFLGGDWNEVGGYLAVKQGNAHSWVEFFVPGVGWLPIDPTPAAEPPPRNAMMEAFREYYDAARMKWMKWVIEYDLSAQIAFFKSIGEFLKPRGLMAGGGGGDGGGNDDGEALVDFRTLLMLGGLLGLGFGSYVRTRRRLRRRRRPIRLGMTVVGWTASGAVWLGWFEGFDAVPLLIGAGVCAAGALAAFYVERRSALPSHAAQRIFTRIEAAAATAELGRNPGEGPATFLARLAEARPEAASELRLFSELYLRHRFGGMEFTDATRGELEELAARIIGKIRQ